MLCDRRIGNDLNGKVDKTVVRPALIYGREGQLKRHKKRLSVQEIAAMYMLVMGKTRKDKIRNTTVKERVGVVKASKV